ncbi:hypothetical protein DFH06DRAFT_1133697 [Mycena polygramma]|nr:hypothetical protein DFH06DRAFT_1133697 [Mycena polygramma]
MFLGRLNGTYIGGSGFQPPPQQVHLPEATAAPSQMAYNFPPFAPGPSGHARALNGYPALIDPALLPRPDNDDLALSDPETVAKDRGLKRAHKVGGARQKDKKRGKKRIRSDDDHSDDDTEAPPAKRPGRPKGSANFSTQDVNKALDIIQKLCPMGQKGWKKVARRYNSYARDASRPERDDKSLAAKFKALVKTKKPTGSGHCPPEIKRAVKIEGLIYERAGTREVSDSDVASDSGDGSSDESIELLDSSSAPQVHTAIARRAPTPPPARNPRLNAPDLVNKLAKAFDPEAQQSRDDERSQRSFQTAQLFTVNQQLRDAQATTESLRSQLAAMQQRAHDVERAHDQARFKLQMYESGFAVAPKPRKHQRRSEYLAEHCSDIVRVQGQIRSERIYPDGGRCTEWWSDPSTGDESDKENWDPSSSGSSFDRLSSPFDLPASSSSNPSVFSTAVSSDANLSVPSSSGAGPSGSGAVGGQVSIE